MDLSSPTYDVAIVGAGPVGLTTARLLALRGHRVALIDPQRVVCQHPRATHLDDETMRTLQTLGAADLEKTFFSNYGWELRAADGTPFLPFHMPEGQTDQGWLADYQFHQPDFESRLRGLLVDERVDLLLGYEAREVNQDDGCATVRVVDGRTGQERTVTAHYLVGADGANSRVRQQLGLDVEDLHGTQRSLIVDVHPFHHPESLPKDRGFVVCEDRLPVTYLPIFPPKLRFEFMIAPTDDAHAMEAPSHVYELLRRWMEPGTYRILRTDVYEWHARLARGWRQSRILVAGDAAHEMPPMLGQGLCSGLRDAANLAWKLSAVLRGADDALLDTYETERAPHVRPYIEESARQSNLIEAFADPENRPDVVEPVTLVRHRPMLGPGLVAVQADPVGQLTPQGRDSDGRRLDDLVGFEFLVVGEAETIRGVPDAVREGWTRLGFVVLERPTPDLAAWLESHHADAAIIRPDRYAHAVVRGAHDLAATSLDLIARLSPATVPA